jgi:hypothetical protein
MLIFTNTSTISAGIKTIGGTDNTISDENFVNLLKKWYVPASQGRIPFQASTTIRRQYMNGLTCSQEAYVGGKPMMFTIESDHLIAYTLDYLIPEAVGICFNTFSGTLEISSDLINDGTDKIKRLDGGELSSPGVGTTWTITDEGDVLDDDGNPVLTSPPLEFFTPTNNPNRYPCPFLLARKESS